MHMNLREIIDTLTSASKLWSSMGEYVGVLRLKKLARKGICFSGEKMFSKKYLRDWPFCKWVVYIVKMLP